MKMKPIIIIKGQLALDILEASKVLGLSQNELIEQSLGLLLDWRLMDFCKPTSEDEKLKQIYEFADKIFNKQPIKRCI